MTFQVDHEAGTNLRLNYETRDTKYNNLRHNSSIGCNDRHWHKAAISTGLADTR